MTSFQEKGREDEQKKASVGKLEQVEWDIYFPMFLHRNVGFRAIPPFFANLETRDAMLFMLREYFAKFEFSIACLDSRGYLFASYLGVGTTTLNSQGIPMHYPARKIIMVAKSGKLPGKVGRVSYEKEYGKDTLEIMWDTLKEKEKVMIIDDLNATGGSAGSVVPLLRAKGCDVIGVFTLIQLIGLPGRQILRDLGVRCFSPLLSQPPFEAADNPKKEEEKLHEQSKKEASSKKIVLSPEKMIYRPLPLSPFQPPNDLLTQIYSSNLSEICVHVASTSKHKLAAVENAFEHWIKQQWSIPPTAEAVLSQQKRWQIQLPDEDDDDATAAAAAKDNDDGAASAKHDDGADSFAVHDFGKKQPFGRKQPVLKQKQLPKLIVKGYETASKVSPQPMSIEETLEGCCNRLQSVVTLVQSTLPQQKQSTIDLFVAMENGSYQSPHDKLWYDTGAVLLSVFNDLSQNPQESHREKSNDFVIEVQSLFSSMEKDQNEKAVNKLLFNKLPNGSKIRLAWTHPILIPQQFVEEYFVRTVTAAPHSTITIGQLMKEAHVAQDAADWFSSVAGKSRTELLTEALDENLMYLVVQPK